MKSVRKTAGIIVVGIAVLLVGSLAAYAQWTTYCPTMGAGAVQTTAAQEALAKYQSETATLRDTLAQKQTELTNEYAKPAPDGARITKLQTELSDLYARINAAGFKYGVAACPMCGMAGQHTMGQGNAGMHCPMMGGGMGQGSMGHGCMGRGMMQNRMMGMHCCW